MNPLDKKVNLSIGELIKICIIIKTIYAGGTKDYLLLRDTNALLKQVNGKLQYIHTIFKESEEK